MKSKTLYEQWLEDMDNEELMHKLFVEPVIESGWYGLEKTLADGVAAYYADEVTGKTIKEYPDGRRFLVELEHHPDAKWASDAITTRDVQQIPPRKNREEMIKKFKLRKI